jgi:uncharacterized protein YdbL (DUF1318 family)
MASRRIPIALALALMALLALPAAGSGLDLDAAKSQGLVGEKADGYVGIVVADPTAPVTALVKNVNARRQAAYEAIAKKNGTAVDAVAALAGAKLIERASRGDWVTDTEGNWRQK